MLKYRIIKKVILHDSLDYDQAKYAIQNLEENENEEMHIEEYEVKAVSYTHLTLPTKVSV